MTLRKFGGLRNEGICLNGSEFIPAVASRRIFSQFSGSLDLLVPFVSIQMRIKRNLDFILIVKFFLQIN
jgi:hypothetical protein